jgi:hypothetical protein
VIRTLASTENPVAGGARPSVSGSHWSRGRHLARGLRTHEFHTIAIRREGSIVCQQQKGRRFCLCDEHPVEGILVEGGQQGDGSGMVATDRQELKPGRFHFGQEFRRICGKLAERGLDA